jgi:hypothetical protein
MFASCSSKAERPADNRRTAERYRAGRPSFAKATDGGPSFAEAPAFARRLRRARRMAGYLSPSPIGGRAQWWRSAMVAVRKHP